MVALYTQAAPVRELLLDVVGRAFRLQSEGMAAEIQQLASRGVARVMEFLGEARQRIARVQGLRVECCVRAQDGACITVPQMRQVRSCSLP
jgi:hypothetical protein